MGTGYDINPNTRVRVEGNILRIWTSQRKRVRTPLGSFSEPSMTGVTNGKENPFGNDEEDEEVVKRGTLFQFPTEDDSQKWHDAIIEERSRYHLNFVNFPVISIGKSIEHAIQFEIARKSDSVEKLRRFYYHLISKNEETDYTTLLSYLYNVVFSSFAEKDLAANVDIFVYLLSKVC